MYHNRVVQLGPYIPSECCLFMQITAMEINDVYLFALTVYNSDKYDTNNKSFDVLRRLSCMDIHYSCL